MTGMKSKSLTLDYKMILFIVGGLFFGALLFRALYLSALEHLALGSWQTLEQIRPFDLSHAFCPPTISNPFGCDAYGRDLLDVLAVGMLRTSSIVVSVTALTAFFGVALGSLASLYPASFLGRLLNYIIDVWQTFPGLIMALFVAAYLPHGLLGTIFSLFLMGWAPMARIVRNLIFQISKATYIDAASSLGASTLRIYIRHMLPALWPQVQIQLALGLAPLTLAEASLSFLGVGGTLTTLSWGSLLADGRSYVVEAPLTAIVPGVLLLGFLLWLQYTDAVLRRGKPLQQ